MLNLEWLRTFKTIYEKGTLSAAAQVLFISQPGVSLHLNALEAYTGYRLFERENRKMTPTDRGVLLYNVLIDPINKLEKAEELFHRNSKFEKPTISVGMCFESFEYALEEYITELSFNLIVRTGDYPQMIHELETGELDLVLTPQRGYQASVDYAPFSKQRIILICGAQTDTSEFDDLTNSGDHNRIREWLKNQLWYTNAANMEHLKNFWTLNFGIPPDFKPNFVLPYFSSIIKCLKEGTGFAVVPDFLCRNEIESHTIKLPWLDHLFAEDIMYFGKRIKTIYPNEIEQLQQILTRNWLDLYDSEANKNSRINKILVS
jgi:DNA-binding transcriptional LysR family regulator